MRAISAKKIYNEPQAKTLGERLRSFRKRKHLSLEQAEEETRVRLKYLDALEKGNYSQLPADVYTIGFLSKYTEFLGAPKDELIGLYRRERQNTDFRPLTPLVKFKENRVFLTPRVVILIIVILTLSGLVGYVFYSVKNFTSAPNLEISSPVTDQILRQDEVEIIGKTDEGATLKINDQVVLIDDKGNFHQTVKLQPGLNNIEVSSTNRLQKETVKVIKILAEF